MLSSQGSPPVADWDRRTVVAPCGVEQLLVAAGSSVPSQLSGLRCLVATSDLVDRSSPVCLHRAIQKPYPLRGQCCPLSPRRPQRTAGAVLGGFRRDAAAADAAPQQLVSVVVVAHRIHRIGALCSAGRVAEFAHHAAQADGACRHLRRWRSRGSVGSGSAFGWKPQDCFLSRR